MLGGVLFYYIAMVCIGVFQWFFAICKIQLWYEFYIYEIQFSKHAEYSMSKSMSILDYEPMVLPRLYLYLWNPLQIISFSFLVPQGSGVIHMYQRIEKNIFCDVVFSFFGCENRGQQLPDDGKWRQINAHRFTFIFLKPAIFGHMKTKINTSDYWCAAIHLEQYLVYTPRV